MGHGQEIFEFSCFEHGSTATPKFSSSSGDQVQLSNKYTLCITKKTVYNKETCQLYAIFYDF